MKMPRVVALVSILQGAASMAMAQGSGVDATGWTAREQVRAFYSGHSLSEGVPEAVASIARSRGQRLDFEVQVQGYSLLRQRTKGENPAAPDWPGFRAGTNRSGSGLDVAAELRRPTRLPTGAVYDALVVTERHDLPAIARKERTATYLAEMSKALVAGNPDGEVLFYHTWLNVDLDAPQRWIDYERAVASLWECLAARANRDLPARQGAPRVRVLPGGSALADFAELLMNGKVPGIQAATPSARVRLLFTDHVHMTEFGRYYIALLHYAVLFGRDPTGADIPSAIPAETGRFMQSVAWQQAVSYGARAAAAVQRDAASCRALVTQTVCPAYASYLHGAGTPVLSTIRRRQAESACRRDYAGETDADNPFSNQRP